MIWERVFPAEASRGARLRPARQAEPHRRQRLHVAMNAAFLAARDGSAITMEHVLDAARAETLKLDLPVNEHDFAPRPRTVTA